MEGSRGWVFGGVRGGLRAFAYCKFEHQLYFLRRISWMRKIETMQIFNAWWYNDNFNLQ